MHLAIAARRLTLLLCLAVLPAQAQVAPQETIEIRAGGTISEAVMHYRSGNYTAAARLLRQAVQTYPGEPQLHVMHVSALLKAGRKAQALPAVRKALDEHPNHVPLLLLAGETHVDLEEPAAAINVLEQAQERLEAGAAGPEGFDKARLRRQLGQLHRLLGGRALQRNNFRAALPHFMESRSLMPDSAVAHQSVVYTLLKLERWKEARKAASAALERFPAYAPLLRMHVQASVGAGGEANELLPSLQRLFHLQPDDVEIGLALGRVLLASRKSRQAQAIFEQMMERFPQERRVYDALATINRQTFNVPGAIPVRRREQGYFPKDSDIPLKIARLYEQIGEYENARVLYDSLSMLGGEKSDAYRQASVRTLVQQERLGEAARAYRKILEDSSDDVTALQALGDLQARRHKWEEAMSIYRRLSEAARAPGAVAYAFTHAGRALEELGRINEAFDAYEQAVALEPDAPLSYYRYAVLVYRRHGSEEALPYARNALLTGLEAVKGLQTNITNQLQGEREYPPAVEAEEQRKHVERLNELVAESFIFFGEAFPRERTEPVVRDVLQRYPGSGRLLYLAGRYYEAHSQEEEAVRHYHSATRHAPKLRVAHIALGALRAQGKQWNDAILSYERALALDEENPDVYSILINLYQEANNLDALIRRWKIRYRADPSIEALHQHLIEALHKARRYDEARVIIQSGR